MHNAEAIGILTLDLAVLNLWLSPYLPELQQDHLNRDCWPAPRRFHLRWPLYEVLVHDNRVRAIEQLGFADKAVSQINPVHRLLRIHGL